MENEIIIDIRDLHRNFKVGSEIVHALNGVSFSIREGEFVSIMGTSGSGKSTLLNILGCLDTPSSGDYILSGTSINSLNTLPRIAQQRQNHRLRDPRTRYRHLHHPHHQTAGRPNRARRKH